MLALATAITLASCLAPPEQKGGTETIEHYGTVETVTIDGDDYLVALIPPVQGKADAGCKFIVTVDTESGLIIEIRCDTLPLCIKQKGTCVRTQDGTTPGGGIIWSCPCVE